MELNISLNYLETKSAILSWHCSLSSRSAPLDNKTASL